MFHETELSPVERQILARVDYFAATAFRGRGKFDVVKSDTLSGVFCAAKQLFDDRPILIYAIDQSGRQAMIGSWKIG